MDTQKNFFILFGEWLQARQARRATAAPPRHLTAWLPSRGNVIFTLLMIALLVAAQTVGALPLGRPQGIAPTSTSTSTIAYQGRLADAAGAPLTGTYNMIFRLYDAGTGGTPLWEEQWTGSNGVKVSDGLFNVMLGSLTPLPISQFTNYPSLFLGITVGTDDEMAPRVQLGSVPFAVQALTVPDGSVTTAKIADGAVTQGKLGTDVSLVPPDGSITTAKIADGAVTQAKLASGLGRDLSAYVYNDNSRTTTDSQHCIQLDPADVITITLESPSFVEVLFGARHMGNSSVSGVRTYLNLFVDDEYAEGTAGGVEVVAPAGYYPSATGAIRVALPSGMHTFKLCMIASGGTAVFQRRWIMIRAMPQ